MCTHELQPWCHHPLALVVFSTTNQAFTNMHAYKLPHIAYCTAWWWWWYVLVCSHCFTHWNDMSDSSNETVESLLTCAMHCWNVRVTLPFQFAIERFIAVCNVPSELETMKGTLVIDWSTRPHRGHTSCVCTLCRPSYACVRVALTSDQRVVTHIQSWGASTPHQIETFIVRLEGSWGGLLWVPALGNVVHEFDEWQCSRHTPACTPLHTEQLAGSMSLVNLPSTCRSHWLKYLRMVTFLSRWQLIPPLPYGYLVGLLSLWNVHPWRCSQVSGLHQEPKNRFCHLQTLPPLSEAHSHMAYLSELVMLCLPIFVVRFFRVLVKAMVTLGKIVLVTCRMLYLHAGMFLCGLLILAISMLLFLQCHIV